MRMPCISPLQLHPYRVDAVAREPGPDVALRLPELLLPVRLARRMPAHRMLPLTMLDVSAAPLPRVVVVAVATIVAVTETRAAAVRAPLVAVVQVAVGADHGSA